VRKFLHSLYHCQKGFTLIELLVVIAILGALAGVAVPNVGKFIGEGKTEATEIELQNVEMAMALGMTLNDLDSVSAS
jgi:prepilin-type N-terminal cleavage/methylation domain-containing protein